MTNLITFQYFSVCPVCERLTPTPLATCLSCGWDLKVSSSLVYLCTDREAGDEVESSDGRKYYVASDYSLRRVV